ncbi:Intercellular adhesion protein R [Listeria grayi]|uniref:Putative TetR/AcrR family transcriptional regulator n=1 Tax=Listeria grayi FSL F6-1183 TaxID=1265827 RepID=A0A829R691_LISGR|nr:TetR/AcrR family transcriptional regulator [Listeria grayi]EUJ27513.1 putative TetR/AcrR family transcriptional regulator [Listeria grayi FSL F6-1183]VEI35342.1 Intercellular adhesion protein R [Listeria grayi]
MSKETIKSTALHFFAEIGYEATSLAKIAAEVGIKKPSIYAHFSSKEALFLEVYQDVLELELQKIKQLQKQGKKGEALLEALFYYLTDINTDKLGKQFSQRAIFYPPEAISESVKNITQTFENLTVEIMEQAVPAYFTKAQTLRWMHVFYMMLDGLLMEGNLYESEEITKRRESAWLFLKQALTQKEA